jgi:hypothetical protein
MGNAGPVNAALHPIDTAEYYHPTLKGAACLWCHCHPGSVSAAPGICSFGRIPAGRPDPNPRQLTLCTLKTAAINAEKPPETTVFWGIWSECGGSNPGPRGPKPRALPTAPHPVLSIRLLAFKAVLQRGRPFPSGGSQALPRRWVLFAFWISAEIPTASSGVFYCAIKTIISQRNEAVNAYAGQGDPPL